MDDDLPNPTDDYEYDEFVVADSDSEWLSDHGADIDACNIILDTKRQRRPPQRYVDSDLEELMLADVPETELEAVYEDDDDDDILSEHSDDEFVYDDDGDDASASDASDASDSDDDSDASDESDSDESSGIIPAL